MEEQKNNNLLPDFLFKKEECSFRDFLGARKETILRLEGFYKKNYFDESDGRYDPNLRREVYRQELVRIANYFDLNKGGKVLDFGCGEGTFLSMFPDNWEKYGVDISGFALQEASKKGINVDFEFKDGFFDLIIFRGTIQHIPDPISKIEKCYYWLKNKGGLIFLITPNTNSIYYKLFNNLPLLNPPLNFFVPSDIVLKQILTNFGFNTKGIEYPYLGTPYASPVRDLFYFILKTLRIKKNITFPFYRNIMEVYAEKPQTK